MKNEVHSRVNKQHVGMRVFYLLFPKSTDFDNQAWIRIILWKSNSSVKFQYTIGAKRSEGDISLLPEMAQVCAKRDPLDL